ncbi:hypothetical protein KRP22_009874 [Phytophthora ramorum]|nr:hypothetical protein KRP22_10047 [Phytophthora ramorum]
MYPAQAARSIVHLCDASKYSLTISNTWGHPASASCSRITTSTAVNTAVLKLMVGRLLNSANSNVVKRFRTGSSANDWEQQLPRSSVLVPPALTYLATSGEVMQVIAAVIGIASGQLLSDTKARRDDETKPRWGHEPIWTQRRCITAAAIAWQN